MASVTPIRCSATVESKASGLVEPCQRILSALREKGFSDDDAFAVHLAMEEAFLNAAKHGNKLDPTKMVTIRYLVCDDRVEIEIADEGDGFNPEQVPDPRVGDNLYRPEGRGLLLIHASSWASEAAARRFADAARGVFETRHGAGASWLSAVEQRGDRVVWVQGRLPEETRDLPRLLGHVLDNIPGSYHVEAFKW